MKTVKTQVRILILASLIFYAWHDALLLLLLLTSAGVNILTSFYVIHNKKNKKLIASIGVISNLSILAFFKYSGLIAKTVLNDSDFSEFLISIPLPIGISFFTFQGISLLVDVYKENHFENKKIIPNSLATHAQNTLFFIAFFPQLIAGPIVKAHDFLPQIKIKTLNTINWEKCFKNILTGYFLKMVIADNLKDFTFWISYPYFESKDSVSLVTMLFGYSNQIFADFAGYSLIAIGIAGLFGYNLHDNFNFPYISTSFKEFWKRWHISLSSFLMEYLYIPIGGNRKGKYRTYINLMITMILGGLWHGAAWSYAIWGLFHGLALALERVFSPYTRKIKFPGIRFLQWITIFSLVTIAWLLFKLPEFDHVIKYIEAIYNNFTISFERPLVIKILIYSSPILIYHLIYLYVNNFGKKHLKRFEFIFYSIMLLLILVNSGTPGDFIYFQF
ncbi:MBOAT family O-acyltransferase [Dokdonia sp.]|uniref:MBOAT family O-acyltransferase n=1 Tax=Dokdonia sp. TaxID=2024995 RepID=UPI0032637D31